MSDIKNVDFDKKYYSRFCRLNKITNRYYHYLLLHTNDAVPKILESSREEFDRIIIFRSKNIIEHYNELIKIFMLNSLLQKRISHPPILPKSAPVSHNLRLNPI